jgi:synaptic vesicle membrane protein VAT-1
MKQIWITKYGGPEALEVREAPLKAPGEGEVTVAVKAAGVNFADLMARKGLYPDAPQPPCVVGYEAAGVVETLGPGVPPQWRDKEVFALTHFGGYSEKINVPIGQLFEMPSQLTFQEAAAIPVNYLTAYQLVAVMGGLKADETLLIHNAGGGVGLAALQLARHIGAKAIGTASPSKHAFLKEQGLHQAVDYRQADWPKKVMDLTQGRGVDLILDPVGGPYWRKNYRLLRPTGRLGAFGVSSATESKGGRLLSLLKVGLSTPWFNMISLMNSNHGVFGVNLGHLWGEREKIALWAGAILRGVKEGWIKPRVDRSFSFTEVGEAHRYIEERRNLGKVVLTP